MRAHILAEEYRPERLWTTRNAARKLGVTVYGVRWLARSGRLRHELTESGQLLFRQSDVSRLADQRSTARMAARPHVDGPVGEPRQLSLFGKARLRLVTAG